MTNHADTSDHDFRQFAGRFDAPVAPSPAFAVQVRQRLDLAPGPVPSPVQPVTVPVDAVPAGSVAEVPGQLAVDVPWRAPRWMRAIEAAVAVLLVVSLAAASLYFRQPAAVYDLAFQPGEEETAFNYAGNAGRTWVLGDVEPEMGGFRQDPTIDLGGGQFAGPDPSSILIDNSYVFMANDTLEDELVRYELDSHERAWSVPIYVTGKLASDGERIFAMRSDRMITTDSATLVAIDFETGELAWEGPELANRGVHSSSLALSGDTVVATDYLGNVAAVNKADGRLLWQFPETFAVPSADEDFISGPQFYTSPEIAVNDTAVFLSRPSRAILKLDRETGEELGTINLVDHYGADIITSLVQVRDQRLVITAIQAPRSEDPEAIRDYMPTSILLFDAQTLELQSRTEPFDFRGNLVVTDDSIYVATAAAVDDDAALHRVNLSTGSLGEPLDGVSARWDIALSVSGNVLMATGDPSTVAFFNLETDELLDSVELGITGMETPIYRPVEMWGDNPIVITATGLVYVVTDEPVGATPAR